MQRGPQRHRHLPRRTDARMIALALTGLGLVLLIEGLVYALAPSLIEDMLAALRSLGLPERRLVGLAVLATGAALLWLAALIGT
ncbi:MAG: hypothetical protein ACI9U6_003773 [Loktanella salsilacus]|jgi:uncharacterized protein YjeT (DUF2065 family)|uniref:DUF2065 domain-containing protein n=2 Tax=Loktanella salsilacus TaxID=195913 RepID=A0A1I4ET57_9RHOB|nr:hypothetical protein SAMN04488004_107171 [Loktanella salsilacus]